MRRSIIPTVLAAAALWLHADAGSGAPLGSVRLDVTGIIPGTGTLMVALHDSREGLEGHAKPVRVRRAAVTGARMQIAFDDLPPAYYAVAVYQDVNGNGELDRSGRGVPSEPVGFSNNAMGRRGPPDFAAAAFLVNAADVPHAIRLIDLSRQR